MNIIELCVEQISTYVQSLENKYMEEKGFKNLKSIRLFLNTIDKLLIYLIQFTDRLQQLKIRVQDKIDEDVSEYKDNLDNMSAYFKKRIAHVNENTKEFTFRLGDPSIEVRAVMYVNRSKIPPMSYGAVIINKKPVILFHYTNNNFVSCTNITVVDTAGSNNNYRTICCDNGKLCLYGDNCRYYHDVCIEQKSTHVQRFPKTIMVKMNPYFGSSEHLQVDTQSMAFVDVQTLARYCSIMMLFIKQISSR